MKADSPLKQLIRDVPPGTVIFRTDYPEYNAEFVGNVLSRLVSDGDIVRLSHGIYCRPQMSRFGAVMPGMAQIARSIARRDGARILPAGVTALNELGLSDQVPGDKHVPDGRMRQKNTDWQPYPRIQAWRAAQLHIQDRPRGLPGSGTEGHRQRAGRQCGFRPDS